VCTAPALFCVRMEGPLLWAEGQVSLASIQRSTPNRQSHDSSLRVGTRPRILPTQYCLYTVPPLLWEYRCYSTANSEGSRASSSLGVRGSSLVSFLGSSLCSIRLYNRWLYTVQQCIQTRASNLAFTKCSNSATSKHLSNCSRPVSILIGFLTSYYR
jgi:hypothetical protein